MRIQYASDIHREQFGPDRLTPDQVAGEVLVSTARAHLQRKRIGRQVFLRALMARHGP